MMASLNKVHLIGNLGRDPETRYTPSGDCITTFSMATTEKWVNKQTGEKHEKTEWHTITAFNGLAEICAKFLRKGSSVYCEGKLQTHKYTDKDGIEKYHTKIIIDSMQILGNRPTEQTNSETKPIQKEPTIIEKLNDDIPF